MPSSPSVLLNVELQAAGENLNTWGGLLNGTINRLTEAIAQITTVPVTSPTTTLTSTNYVANQARSAGLLLTGTLTANTNIVAPSQTKIYLISNATTGGFALTINTLTGAPLTLRNGSIPYWVYCDGTNFVTLDLTLDQIRTAAANVSMGTRKFTGLLKGSVTGDSASLDNAISDFLGAVTANIPMAGFTFTGLPAATLAGRPVTLANSLDQLAVPAANVPFNSKKITGLADGSVSSQDAASVQQVQNLITAAVVPAGNGMARVDVSDTTNGFLDAKLVPSSIMQRTIGNVGGNETYIFDAKTFTGATSGVAGTRGVVPAPVAGQQASFLRGDSSWAQTYSTPNPVTGATAIGTAARGTDVQWSGTAASPTIAAGSTMGACSFAFQNTNDGKTNTGAALLTMASGDTLDGRPSIYVYPGEGFSIDGPGGANAAWTTRGRGRKGALILIQEQNPSGAASVTFSSGFTDTEIESIEFEIVEATNASGSDFGMRLGISGSIQLTANYGSSTVFTTSNNPAPNGQNFAAGTYWLLSTNTSATTTSAKVAIPNVQGGGSSPFHMYYLNGVQYSTTNTISYDYTAAGFFTGTAGAITSVQMMITAGSITAKAIRQYGRRV